MTNSPQSENTLKQKAYEFVVAESTTFRLDRSPRFWAAGALLLGLIACATGDVAQTSLVAPETRTVSATVTEEPAKPQIDMTAYIGGTPADLEVLVGMPALIRKAGAYEFRRYNLNDCRVMAVVAAPADGVKKISELKVADAKAAGSTRDINSCV